MTYLDTYLTECGFPYRRARTAREVIAAGMGDIPQVQDQQYHALRDRLVQTMAPILPRSAELFAEHTWDAAVLVNTNNGSSVAGYLACSETEYDAQYARLWIGGPPNSEPAASSELPPDLLRFSREVHSGFLWDGEGAGPLGTDGAGWTFRERCGGSAPDWWDDAAFGDIESFLVVMPSYWWDSVYCSTGPHDVLTLIDPHLPDDRVRRVGTFAEEADSLMCRVITEDAVR
ncbi:hypothetical protein TPB0596_20740 [Tsukamurella pulmonis]|uniref:hypothetical protein n=1 Tax=Tsukamurella pulmonis TaxID=47312 RepID=UPI001EDEF872|nr:hypothetical protein [Tsukamurella pulmonis]BDD82311.1 hypothetical protein TPB0596_20740 [Tsukamurella pulmonis]